MACTCKNVDGEPSQLCHGCMASRMIPGTAVFRAQEDKFTETQLKQIRGIIQELKLDNLWIDGFLKGFEHGQQS